jgi:multidrug efflux pump subunit AcrA (membrane-fusion protein)
VSDPGPTPLPVAPEEGVGPAREWFAALEPRWLERAYWLLVTLAVSGLAVAVALPVREFSTGPAVIRTPGRSDLTTQSGGVVEAITAQPGRRVEAGEVLVRFHTPAERAELEAARREFDESLTRALADPGDVGARQLAASQALRRQVAEAKLVQREVRAPRAGLVRDVHIRVGQRLSPGELVLTLVPEDAPFSVMALLPARDLALLQPGQTLELELDGYPLARQRLVVASRSDLPVTPDEARRFLGPQVADVFSLTDPVVIVEAHVAGAEFRAAGRSYGLHDGMQGSARVTLRSSRAIELFVPALKALTPAAEAR